MPIQERPGDRWYVAPAKPIPDMTEDELDAFADGLAVAMKGWVSGIAAKDTAATERSVEMGCPPRCDLSFPHEHTKVSATHEWNRGRGTAAQEASGTIRPPAP